MAFVQTFPIEVAWPELARAQLDAGQPGLHGGVDIAADVDADHHRFRGLDPERGEGRLEEAPAGLAHDHRLDA